MNLGYETNLSFVVDLQVHFNFPRHRTKLPLVLKQNIKSLFVKYTEDNCCMQYLEGYDLIIMAVPTG